MTALVLGHKNPDTDSIVSALSATYLYRARGVMLFPALRVILLLKPLSC